MSYTGVTVGAMLVVELILIVVGIGLFFSLLNNGTLPRLIIDKINRDFVPSLRPYLEESPPDVEGIAAWLERDSTSSDLGRVPVFDEFTINLNQDGVLVVGSDEQLLGMQPYALVETATVGQRLPADAMPGLAAPLKAALAGEGDFTRQYARPGNSIVIAIPVWGDAEERVLGVLVVSYSMPTPVGILGELTPLFGISLIGFTIPAGVLGTIFGLLTARGLVRRLNRLSEATRAWSRGNFSVFVDDPSGDELGQLASRLNRMAEQLQNLLDTRRELAVVEERNRLARDLHDSAKQQAFAVAAQIGTARALLKHNPEAAESHLIEAERLTYELRRELTNLIQELRPAMLQGKGLAAALREYAADWSRQNRITLEMRIQGERVLPLEIEQTIFRIVQEALANVARHSEASSGEIGLVYTGDDITLSVSDDGRGFDVNAGHSGFGLGSMQERVRALGGNLSIESVPGKGTHVSCTVPLDMPGAEGEVRHGE